MNLAITGHRPPRLGLNYSMAHRDFLELFAEHTFNAFDKQPVTVYAGGAQGWDQAVMHSVLLMERSKLVAAIPFHGHEQRWPAESQAYYRDILDGCSMVKFFGESYKKHLFTVRDHWMVNQADKVLALFDGLDEGGTALTVAYALSKGVPVENCWDKWVKFRDEHLRSYCDNYEN